MYMNVFLYICKYCNTCIPGAHRGQKRVWISWNWNLLMFMSCPLGSGKVIYPLQEQEVFLTPKPFLKVILIIILSLYLCGIVYRGHSTENYL